MTQPARDVAQNRSSGPTVKVKFELCVPRPLWPLLFVLVARSSAQGPFADAEANIWPGTISPTDSV